MAARLTRVVVFAKAPVAGRVKTRLTPSLGADGAAAFAALMLRDTVAHAQASGLEVELCVDPPADAPDWHPFLPAGVRCTDQGSGDLGERLAGAAKRVIEAGEAVLLIGTDCPALDADRLRDAATMLKSHDAVMLPAEDGGYVLLGLGRFDDSLFAGISWSTETVADATAQRIAALGWSLFVGETLRDIDEPGDLTETTQTLDLPPRRLG